MRNNGIAHFHDSEWHIYNQTNSILKSNEMIEAAIAPSGRKWFLTKNAIYSLKDQKWREYTKENTSKLQFPLFDIAVDQLGQVWFSGYSIFCFVDEIWSIYDASSVNIYTTPDNIVWLFSEGSFYKIENNNLKKIEYNLSKIHLYVSTFIVDWNNSIWAILEVGDDENEMDLVCIKDEKATTETVLAYAIPFGIFLNSSEELIIYTSKGLYKVKNGNLLHINYFKENMPEGICEDGQYSDLKYSPLQGKGNLVNYQEERHWIYTNDNSQIILEGDFIAGKKVGIWKTYFDNGSIKTMVKFENGFRNGHYTEHYKNGNKRNEGSYSKDKKIGEWINWLENGNIRKKTEYRDDKKTGSYTIYDYKNGAYSEIKYVTGNRVGEGRYINSDGKSIYSLKFPTAIKQPDKLNENGNKQGKWITFMWANFKKCNLAEDATYYRIAEYEDGVPQGIVRDYHKDGTLQFEGKMISEFPSVYAGKIRIYNHGKLKEEREYFDKEKNGLEEVWDNDILIRKGNYENGLHIGFWIETIKNKRYEGEYVNGKRNGLWKVYLNTEFINNIYYKNGKSQKPINLKKIFPTNLIKMLEKASVEPVIVPHISADNWALKMCLNYLMNKIESKKECAPVVSTESLHWPEGEMSTIGREAMYMIQGFIDGKYPPTECSVTDFNPKVKYYKKWWEKYQKNMEKK
ncbi:MAG: hypothetical protein HOD64_05140 [Candidatus Cloacimonetes bacterium]|nr:hypothetical protein [Candidatus Cloacimonadota bacterium]MBT4332645.1 hypothetical protein [Candidatus Cloacimonadota bacterium]